jgi:RHS repeat-associated protein
MTDTNGDSLAAIKYLPFGECRNSPPYPTDILFTRQRLDDTGLYYYGARYYDPTIGRFISADMIIPNPTSPQAFNRYSYCLNNPLKYVDPSGNIVEFGEDSADIQAAWQLYLDTCPDIANMMINSDIIFTLQWGDGEGSIAYTEPSDWTLDENGNISEITAVDVILDRDKVMPDREGTKGISAVLSNEIVHCIAWHLDPSIMPATLFEETISFQYQYIYSEMIDYHPTTQLWQYFILFLVKTPMQQGYTLAKKATENIDLSLGPGDELNKQLYNFYRNTTYAGTYFYAFPSWTEYWELMDELQNIFLE